MSLFVRLLAVAPLFMAATLAGSSAGATTSAGNCEVQVNMQEVQSSCTYSPRDLRGAIDGSPEVEYTVHQACLRGSSGEAEVCSNPQACYREGSTGTLYLVRRNGDFVGTVCLLSGEDDQFSVSLPDLVLERFRAIDWPESGIEVQPRGGRTLVNLDTLFYTENAQASSRSVRLLNRSVTIEAVPVEYVWHFGDGSSSATASAGTEYVEGQEVLAEGRVTHRYVRVAGDVSPRVDTTYRGRYRVGDGAWQPIEATLTVEGEPVSLEVVEARPQLVR